MASIGDSFKVAVERMFGPMWEVTQGIDNRITVHHRGNFRDLPFDLSKVSRSSAGVVLERTREAIREMIAELDPGADERERAHEERRERIRVLEAELAGAKAIIADLFRQSREGGD